MTRCQRAKRYAFWRGMILALVVFTGYCFILSWSGEMTAEHPTTSQR